MSVIHRRVFFAKVGQADPLVSHFQEVDKEMRKHGVDMKTRILTDHLSGRSDRVGWQLPKDRPSSATGWKKLNGFILYSEADNWHVR